MANQLELDKKYIEMAQQWAELSPSKRRKVGCFIVKGTQIISDGYNGTPSGDDNCCEDEQGKTKPEVYHAEENAILKLACSTQSSEGATCYITLLPCLPCSKLLVGAKISRVVYLDSYETSLPSIEFLKRRGVKVHKLSDLISL